MINIFFWKKNKQIDMFAKQMADEFYSAVPHEAIGTMVTEKKKMKKKKKNTVFEAKLNDISSQINQYSFTNKLGVYGKARLHLTFIGRLEQLGYDSQLAKDINELILF